VAHTDASDGVELARLAEEQAALRRVATLVAQRAEPSSLFALVAEQVARVLHVPLASIVRFEGGATVVQRASYSDIGAVFPSDKRWPLGGTSALAQVHAHGGPARVEDYSGMEGEIAEYVRRVGIRSTVAVPIVVAGRMWGAMVVSATEATLPADTEARLTDFTELLATAIANSESQEEVTRLAEEQAALRRVATLVAHGVPPDELCGAVGAEVGRLLGVELAGISRYDPDDFVTHFTAWSAAGTPPDIAGRTSRDSDGMSKTIRDTGRPARLDEWHQIPGVLTGSDRGLMIRSAVGSPIVVENRVWGKLVVASTQSPLAPDTESRLRHSRSWSARRSPMRTRGARYSASRTSRQR
jgi:GAF domain-containing protein